MLYVKHDGDGLSRDGGLEVARVRWDIDTASKLLEETASCGIGEQRAFLRN